MTMLPLFSLFDRFVTWLLVGVGLLAANPLHNFG